VKVAAVTPLYPPTSRVGAWLATHEFLAHLAGLGHDVSVWAYLSNAFTPPQMTVDGVTVYGYGSSVDDASERAAVADVVLGHCGDNGQAADVATASGKPLVQMFHGGHRGPSHRAALVVFNSEASKRSTRWDGPSIVCHPWTDPGKHQSDPGEHVTIVNCSKEKGVLTAVACAAQRPNHRWLAVLGGHGEQVRAKRANVETIAPTQHMRRDVWPRTRVLVMPSRTETWGMVGVEALASGIPVIASDLPGLRESLGPAGIFVPPKDTSAWLAALDHLHDPANWSEASTAALARSRELVADDPRPRFAEAVERVAMGDRCTSPS